MPNKVITISEDDFMKKGMDVVSERGKDNGMMACMIMALVLDLSMRLFHPDEANKKEEA